MNVINEFFATLLRLPLTYYAAQIGLAAAAAGSLGILHFRSKDPVPPPKYYYVIVWIVGMASAGFFASSFGKHTPETILQAAYCLGFLFGLERAMVLFYYHAHTHHAASFSLPLIRRVNMVLGIATVVLLVSGGLYGCYDLVRQFRTELQSETQRVERRINKASVSRAAQVDTVQATLIGNRQLMLRSIAIGEAMLQAQVRTEARLNKLEEARRSAAKLPRDPRPIPTPQPLQAKPLPHKPVRLDSTKVKKHRWNFWPFNAARLRDSLPPLARKNN